MNESLEFKRITEQTMMVSSKMEELFKAAMTFHTYASNTNEDSSPTFVDETEKVKAEFKKLFLEMVPESMAPRYTKRNHKREGKEDIEVTDFVVLTSTTLVFYVTEVLGLEYGGLNLKQFQSLVEENKTDSDIALHDIAEAIFIYVDKVINAMKTNNITEIVDGETILHPEALMKVHFSAGTQVDDKTNLNAISNSVSSILNYCMMQSIRPGMIHIIDDLCNVTIARDYSDIDIIAMKDGEPIEKRE